MLCVSIWHFQMTFACRIKALNQESWLVLKFMCIIFGLFCKVKWLWGCWCLLLLCRYQRNEFSKTWMCDSRSIIYLKIFFLLFAFSEGIQFWGHGNLTCHDTQADFQNPSYMSRFSRLWNSGHGVDGVSLSALYFFICCRIFFLHSIVSSRNNLLFCRFSCVCGADLYQLNLFEGEDILCVRVFFLSILGVYPPVLWTLFGEWTLWCKNRDAKL